MNFPERNKRTARFATDSSGVISDESARRGIIILGILLVLLIVFFFWYNNRSLGKAGLESEQAPAGFFSRIFSSDTPEQTAALSDGDMDGLADDAEAQVGTDPLKADTDGDGLTDREEVKVYKTDPKKSDTDGDGVADGEEIKSRRDPLDKNPSAAWPPAPAASVK